ncbi:MAG: AAA family ATPase [Candidatus Thiothrix putei]|uniref:AAA family ATPase n=1 Tax=Candidatus Thiothrix putei TaxID=3080811 RepID=A0AA95HBA1_9GAMM|nr:MAG: AAA family ATPase [Candidatus Thiothrix putei]
MKLPYGIANFEAVISEGYEYVDRTAFLPLLEDAGKQLLFLRPRRFGKSLLLSMLENYYDLNKASRFEEIFGKLAIGQNPTPLHNRYLVMKWDFSAVSPEGDANKVAANLFDYLNGNIRKFSEDYKDLLPTPITIHADNALASFQSLVAVVSQTPHKLYLLIDEYDNFANEIMVSQHYPNHDSRYAALLMGEGVLKSLFKNIKAAAAGLGVDRVFITGVAPIVMSDMSSGYNVATNIYLEERFNTLCGFTEGEISQFVQGVTQACQLPAMFADETLSLMRDFYNGYRFCPEPQQDGVYNPTLALYFLGHLQTGCAYPRRMLDSNLSMDRNKLSYIANLPGGDQLIMTALSQQGDIAIQELQDRFGVHDILQTKKDPDFMASLLYYFGVLTFSREANAFGESCLVVPNLVIRSLYAERLQALLVPQLDWHDHQAAVKSLLGYADIAPLCHLVESQYFPVFSKRDYRWLNELTIKAAFLTLLFEQATYIMDSEAEIGDGYADLTMLIRPDMRHFQQLQDILIEFKYVGLKELGMTAAELATPGQAALEALPPVASRLREGRERVLAYRDGLQSKYRQQLRLHSFVVCALGVERLVWWVV